MIIEPAIANDEISKLNSCKKAFPIYIKPINKISDIIELLRPYSEFKADSELNRNIINIDIINN